MATERQDWQKDLGFADRAAITTEITNAYHKVNPDCSSDTARRFAKNEESTARKNALTLTEYHELCAKSLQLLLSATQTGPIVDEHKHEHIAPNLPETGAEIGRYVNAIHHRDGLFSQVYEAHDPTNIGSTVALKVSTPSFMTAPHNSIREARILRQLKGLKNIIELMEVFHQPGGRVVLVFPFMPYELSTLLVQRSLTAVEQQHILHDLFSGLAEVHANGVIHRDVKPSNILLRSPTGPAYLADFGIAWKGDDPDSEAADSKHLEVGTTCYRPPELLFGGQDYNASLDMWAAGCVAAQVLCLGRKTLFDAGELGSELALIKSIFETLGTPNLDRWPEAGRLPDWGKMNFAQYQQKSWAAILPGVSEEAKSLVMSLVEYESGARATAEEALRSSFLKGKA